jgi:hypothetical protein
MLLIADTLDGIRQLMIGGNEPVEIVLADFQQVRILDRADRGGARSAAEQGHLPERFSLAEHGNHGAGGPGVRRITCQYLNAPMRHDVEGITGLAGLEQNLAGLQLAVVDAR